MEAIYLVCGAGGPQLKRNPLDSTPGTVTAITARDIPLPIQREVRQRCGFGCVMCGLPLYEYEHLLGWAKVQRHVASEITLLCDQHHRECTSGLLPLHEVRRADASPHNLRVGVSKPYDLHYTGSQCEASVGGNRFTTTDGGYGTMMVPVSVDGIPLLGFILADGHLLLNLNVFDESNQLVLRVQNNVLVYKPEPWDIELSGRTLVVREAARRILLEIQFEAPNRIVINRGRFLCNGVEVLIRPDHILLTNNAFLVQGCSADDCTGGLVIGPHASPLGGFMAIQSVSRYLGDRSAAIKWAQEMLGERAV